MGLRRFRELPYAGMTPIWDRVLRESPLSFFLDSSLVDPTIGRFSFLGMRPFLRVRGIEEGVVLERGEGEEIRRGDPFRIVGELLERYAIRFEVEGTRLPGGMVGYLGYELNRWVEDLPPTPPHPARLPLVHFGVYHEVLTLDHLARRAVYTRLEFPDEPATLDRPLERLLDEAGSIPVPPAGAPPPFPGSTSSAIGTFNFTREDYQNAIRRIQEEIARGEIYQANLAQCLTIPLPGDPIHLYRHLRESHPAPFGAYLGCGSFQILSLSPERFLLRDGERIETRPIKGTRPRGGTPEADRALAEELRVSEKDRAEHLMIVDLERNDLGRVSRYGSVTVPELFRLESYATVHHLVSTVEGRLRPGVSQAELLRATFPGGSVTGAPKKRAMEIIGAVEPFGRGVYTGALGYLSFTGGIDLSVVIRTLARAGETGYLHVGGGIVADSDPEEEYRETLHKGEGFFRALGMEIGRECLPC